MDFCLLDVNNQWWIQDFVPRWGRVQPVILREGTFLIFVWRRIELFDSWWRCLVRLSSFGVHTLLQSFKYFYFVLQLSNRTGLLGLLLIVLTTSQIHLLSRLKFFFPLQDLPITFVWRKQNRSFLACLFLRLWQIFIVVLFLR